MISGLKFNMKLLFMIPIGATLLFFTCSTEGAKLGGSNSIMTMEEIRNTRSDSCPVGYEFRSGDMPGWGSDLGGKFILSRQQCADECNKNQDCLSFEHSETKVLCNLNRIAEPTQGPFEDFAFCVKQKDCQDSFSSKTAMESNGWVFQWNDNYVFRPEDKFCKNVPSKSYCGFRYPGEGVISYIFTDSGTATISYGQSWDAGSVHVFLNNEELGSRNTRGTSVLTFRYKTGDILRIKEIGDSVININSLCTTPQDTFECPSGYDAVSEDLAGTGKEWAQPHPDSSRTISDCASICDERQGCTGFEFAEGDSETGACGTYTGGDGNKQNDEGRLDPDSNWRSCIKSPQGYYLGFPNGVCNDVKDVIRNEQTCSEAIALLTDVTDFSNTWSSTYSSIPQGCSIRDGGDLRPHFELSTDGLGIGRKDLIPICYKNAPTYRRPHRVDCGKGELHLSETRKCSSNGYTCLPTDGAACCWGRGTETRSCIPCDQTRLKKPPGSIYSTANTCAYRKSDTCINTRDQNPSNAKCSHQINNGLSCADFLRWKDCDNECNLCACSTARGTTTQHCSGHGRCIAKCDQRRCTGAKCKCDDGWTGSKCQTRVKKDTCNGFDLGLSDFLKIDVRSKMACSLVDHARQLGNGAMCSFAKPFGFEIPETLFDNEGSYSELFCSLISNVLGLQIPKDGCDEIMGKIVLKIMRREMTGHEINNEQVKNILESIFTATVNAARQGITTFDTFLKFTKRANCPSLWVGDIISLAEDVVDFFRTLDDRINEGLLLLQGLFKSGIDCQKYSVILTADIELLTQAGLQVGMYITFETKGRFEVIEVGIVKGVSQAYSLIKPELGDVEIGGSLAVVMGDKNVWGKWGYTITFDGSFPVMGIGVGLSTGLVFTADEGTFDLGNFIGFVVSGSFQVGEASTKPDADVSITCGYLAATPIKDTLRGEDCDNIGNKLMKEIEKLEQDIENLGSTFDATRDTLKRCGGLIKCEYKQCVYNYDEKNAICDDKKDKCNDDFGGCMQWAPKCQKMEYKRMCMARIKNPLGGYLCIKPYDVLKNVDKPFIDKAGNCAGTLVKKLTDTGECLKQLPKCADAGKCYIGQSVKATPKCIGGMLIPSEKCRKENGF